MKKYNRLHQIYLHYLLVNRQLPQDEYNVLTSLTESEVQIWFTPSRLKLTKLLKMLGNVAIYQVRKHCAYDRSWLLSQQCLNQRQYLWSDMLGIEIDSDSRISLCPQSLGLALLAEYNPRNAIIWSIRIGLPVPASVFTVRCPARLGLFIAQLARDADIEFLVSTQK